MKSSWRPSRFWLRRPRLTNESAMLRRSTACSTARSSAESCTVLRASATSATSSRVCTVIGSTWGTATSSPSGVSRMSTHRVGQPVVRPCPWPARVSDRSGRVIDRDTSHTARTVTTTRDRARAPGTGGPARVPCRRAVVGLGLRAGRRRRPGGRTTTGPPASCSRRDVQDAGARRPVALHGVVGRRQDPLVPLGRPGGFDDLAVGASRPGRRSPAARRRKVSPKSAISPDLVAA